MHVDLVCPLAQSCVDIHFCLPLMIEQVYGGKQFLSSLQQQMNVPRFYSDPGSQPKEFTSDHGAQFTSLSGLISAGS